MKRISLIIVMFLILNLAGCAAAPAEENSNFQFTYQGTGIAIDAEAAPILAALGEPKSYTEESSCVFDGLDKTYHYGSFYLVTCTKEGTDYVARIWFADDSVSTQEGICIGASRADVEEAYGDVFGEENSCTVVRGSSKLTILMENDVVTSIQYELIIQ